MHGTLTALVGSRRDGGDGGFYLEMHASKEKGI